MGRSRGNCGTRARRVQPRPDARDRAGQAIDELAATGAIDHVVAIKHVEEDVRRSARKPLHLTAAERTTDGFGSRVRIHTGKAIVGRPTPARKAIEEIIDAVNTKHGLQADRALTP